MNDSTLILVPGLMCDHSVWEPLYAELGKLRQLQVADHGTHHDLTDMASHLLASAPQRFDLAGHSMGGRVALEVMRLAPDRVRRLALLNTGCTPRPAGAAGQTEVDKRMALLHLAQTQGVRAMAQSWVQNMVHPQRLLDTELIDAILVMFGRKTPDHFQAQIQALIHRRDASEVLRQIRCPILIATGSHDDWANADQHQAMHEMAPHSQLVVWAQTGHMATMENPRAVAHSLKLWLQT